MLSGSKTAFSPNNLSATAASLSFNTSLPHKRLYQRRHRRGHRRSKSCPVRKVEAASFHFGPVPDDAFSKLDEWKHNIERLARRARSQEGLSYFPNFSYLLKI